MLNSIDITRAALAYYTLKYYNCFRHVKSGHNDRLTVNPNDHLHIVSKESYVKVKIRKVLLSLNLFIFIIHSLFTQSNHFIYTNDRWLDTSIGV